MPYKYFPSTMKLLKNKDKFYALGEVALNSLFRLLIGIIIARVDALAEFSNYIVFLSIYVIYQNLYQSLYCTPILSQPHEKDHHELNKLFSFGWEKSKNFTLISTVVCIFSAGIYCLFQPATLILLFFALTMLLSPVQLLLRTILQRSFKNKLLLKASIISLTIQNAVLAICYYSNNSLHLGFWVGGAIGQISFILIVAPSMPNKTKDRLPPEKYTSLLRSGKHMLIGSIANSACSRLLPVMLKIISGTTATAYFGVGWTFIGAMRLLSMSLQTIIRPRLALHLKENPEKFKSLLHLSYLTITTLGGFATLIAGWQGTWIIQTLYGEEFTAVGKYLFIAFLYGTIDSLTSIQMISLQISKPEGAKTAANLRIQAATISLLLTIPLCFYAQDLGAWTSILIAELFYLWGVQKNTKTYRAPQDQLPPPFPEK